MANLLVQQKYFRNLVLSVAKDVYKKEKAMGNSVTEEGMKAKITNVKYFQVPDTTLTVCILLLVNGFTVRGESACVDPNNFNKEKGEKLAYADAFRKIWPLEGYLLAERIYQEKVDAK